MHQPFTSTAPSPGYAEEDGDLRRVLTLRDPHCIGKRAVVWPMQTESGNISIEMAGAKSLGSSSQKSNPR